MTKEEAKQRWETAIDSFCNQIEGIAPPPDPPDPKMYVEFVTDLNESECKNLWISFMNRLKEDGNRSIESNP